MDLLINFSKVPKKIIKFLLDKNSVEGEAEETNSKNFCKSKKAQQRKKVVTKMALQN